MGRGRDSWDGELRAALRLSMARPALEAWGDLTFRVPSALPLP